MAEPNPDDQLCKNCGQVVTDFLEQMARHNEKITCPRCGQIHGPSSDQAHDHSRKAG